MRAEMIAQRVISVIEYNLMDFALLSQNWNFESSSPDRSALDHENVLLEQFQFLRCHNPQGRRLKRSQSPGGSNELDYSASCRLHRSGGRARILYRWDRRDRTCARKRPCVLDSRTDGYGAELRSPSAGNSEVDRPRRKYTNHYWSIGAVFVAANANLHPAARANTALGAVEPSLRSLRKQGRKIGSQISFRNTCLLGNGRHQIGVDLASTGFPSRDRHARYGQLSGHFLLRQAMCHAVGL